MTLTDRERELEHYLLEHVSYRMCTASEFDFAVLKKINTVVKRQGGHRYESNEVIIMADTETSKEPGHLCDVYENYLVAWTISIRAAGYNICTLYGSDPRSCIETIEKVHNGMRGNRTYIFFHNLSYDWTFLRRFFFERFGYPARQLNTKPHYPISIEFTNGIILRDSLILAQRNLAKWAQDLDVYDKKATGKWDYDKVRDQGGTFTDDELTYIEHDTLAGVECINATMQTLNKHVCTLPYTATGIVREAFRKVAKAHRGRDWFLRQCLDYDYVRLSEQCYHGGYTHQNRFKKRTVINQFITDGEPIQCYDIASSYPFALCSEKYPAENFTAIRDMSIEDILKASENYAFMFTADLYMVDLKDPLYPMPMLQYSKAHETINAEVDNGRIIKADYVQISLTEIDLKIFAMQYDYNKEHTICRDVIFAAKDYLPKWFTDFVYDNFQAKTQLKGGDPVLYAIAKAKLNSIYGMCVQHVMQDDIDEDYETGDYIRVVKQDEEAYQAYIDNKNTLLPYQIGIWCTCYAMKNLFELGACLKDVHHWIYSDTDSCFGYGWDKEKLDAYNQTRIDIMRQRGYDGIEHNGRKYYLGIVELDKQCQEFIGIHSKCYCYRDATSGKLKITVAGVPKSGAKCLKDNIKNFDVGFTFRGSDTGKLQHTYFYNPIHTDDRGNVIGDSIDLSACDYLIGDINTVTWEDLITDEVEIQVYDEQ